MKQILYIIIGVMFLSCGKRQEYVDALEQLQAQNKAFVPFTSDSLAKDVVSYFDRHGSSNEQMKAHYLLGCVYRDLGESPRAVDCYLDAINKADTTAKDCDFYLLSTVYSQMAELYHQQLLLSFEIDARRQACYYASRANDPYWRCYDMERAAGAYILMNKKDSAELLLKSAIDFYSKVDSIQDKLRATKTLIYLYLEQPSKTKDVGILINNYDMESNLFDQRHELPPSKRTFFYYKGRFYENTGKLDSAEFYYRKVYRPDMPFTAQNSMYRGLLGVFQKRQIADSIAKYAQLYCEANDSSIAKKDQELTAQMAASYNYNRYQKEVIEKEKEADRLLNILVISSTAAIIFVYILWRHHRNKINGMKAEYIKATHEYQNNLHTLELLDTTHKTVVETIQQELNHEKDASQSARTRYNEIQKKFEAISHQYETNRKDLLQENVALKEKIENLKRGEAIYKYYKKGIKFNETDSVKRIKELINAPLAPVEEKDWNQLISTFSLFYPVLLLDLKKEHSITQQHIRTCILTILEVRGLDIANKLNVKEQRVTNMKAEINQALFNDNSARSLYKNLINHYEIYV